MKKLWTFFIVMIALTSFSWGQNIFFEGFETGNTQANAVAGWTQESVTGSGVWNANTSLTDYNRTPRTGSWNAYLVYSNTRWIFKSVTLTGGVPYKFSVWSRQDGSTLTDASIQLSYGTTATAAGMTNLIAAATGIDATHKNIKGVFTPSTTGTYYVGILGFMNSTPWYISLDDISLDVAVTPSAPPTLFTATAVNSSGMTVGWTDNSTNETAFRVYRSTDNVTFTQVGTDITSTTVAGTGTTYSLPQTGLFPGTTYYYKVVAVADAESAPLTGSQATSAPGSINSIANGAWSSAATWAGGVVPQEFDNVVIANNVNVDVASATCYNLTVNSGSTLSCTGTTGVLTVGYNASNNGIIDFYVGASQYATLKFKNANNAVFGGTGTTDLNSLTIDKGSSNANILELNLPNLTVKDLSAAAVGFLTLTNGTLKISGTNTFSGVVFSSVSYTIGATTGFWLNNPNFTVTGQASAATLAGLFRLSNGTFNIGTATGNSLSFSAGAVITIEGGTLVSTGRFGVASSTNNLTYTQTGGSILVNTIGNTSTTYASFDLGTAATTSATMSGGTITIQLANTGGSGPRDFRGPSVSTVYANMAGTTVYLGNASSGATALTFYLSGSLPPVSITNTSAVHKAALSASVNSYANFTIPTGSDLNLNGYTFTVLTPNFTNNGTLTGTTTSSRLSFFSNVAQTFAGSGTITTNLDGISFQNTAGVTLTHANAIPTLRVNLFAGLVTNSNKLTLGTGAALAVTTQIGAAGLTTPGGSFDQAPTFNLGTGTYSLQYFQETTARTTGFEIPATRIVNNVTINNTNGVVLSGGNLEVGIATAGALTLTAGILTTTSSNLLTLAYPATGAISGGSATSYVNGPLARRLPIAAATGTYVFPIGKSGLNTFEIVTPTIVTGTVDIKAEVFDVNSGGTAGSGMSTLDNRYWETSIVANAANFTNATVRFTDAGITTAKAIGASSTKTGAYSSIGFVMSGTTLQSAATQSALGFYTIGNKGNLSSGTYTVGTSGNYTNLTAVATALKSSTLTGNVTFELQADYSGEPGFPINFEPFGGNYNVIIRPASGVTAITSGDGGSATALINLNGIDNITFDGRSGGVGSTPSWTIRNTRSAATYGPTFQFINDATYNTLTYLNIESQNLNTSSGTVVFSTTTGTTGNDNNTISYCNLRDRSDAVGQPFNAIYASGTFAKENDNITITNNNIFNFWNPAGTSAGIYLTSYNTVWNITNNSFYQTGALTATAAATVYGIYNASSLNNFTITGNYIGGSAANCGGSAWTVGGAFANRFAGMYLSVGTTIASSVQNNIIKNFNWTSTSAATTVPGVWGGIYVPAGNVNIGNVTANTIGDPTTTGSILVTTSTTGGVSAGIMSAGTTVNISNNIIAGINVAGNAATISASFNGIWTTSGTTTTINNNTIGSTTIANSINASYASTGTTAQVVQGIVNSSSATIAITNNTIANLGNAYVPAIANTSTHMRGILSSSGINTITGNTIRDISVASNGTGTTSAASVIGISMTSTTSGASNVSLNTIYNLSNIHATAAAAVTGIHYAGNTSTAGVVARNMVYNLVTNNTYAYLATTDALVRGINFASGLANIQNNVIRLGLNITNGVSIAGIYEAVSTTNSGIYFNSVYIGGNNTSTLIGNTYAFKSTQTGNTRTFQNNVFMNARSNSTTGGKHYAVNVAGTAANPGGLALNYNDYFVNGTGGVFGLFNALDVADFAAWKLAVGQDANSVNGDPKYTAPTAIVPNLNLQIATPCESAGLNIASITDDYTGQVRSTLTPVDLGAYAGNFAQTGIDMGVTAMVTPATSGCFGATEAVKVTIKNFTGDAINFVNNPTTVTVTGSGLASAYNSTFVINTGTLAGLATMDITLPATVSMLVSGTYTFNANTTVANATDLNSANDAMSPVSRVVSQLAGSYNVGVGGAYTTLTAAVNAYNAATCINGAVTFVLTDVDYSTNETFPITINANATASAINTLTIKPASGINAVITGTLASNAIIKLNGADYVIIDGSNNGTSSRNLSIINSASTTGIAGVLISSLGNGAGATYNTIKNCKISTGAIGTSSILTYGIVVGSTIATSGADNDYNTIQNNEISKAYVGIWAQGTAATNPGQLDNLMITNNSIGSATATDYIGHDGIFAANATASAITGNTIYNIITTNSTPVGITLSTGFISSIVNKNNINNITYTGTSGYGGRGMYINTASATSDLKIVNNFVSVVGGDGYTGFSNSSPVGLYFDGTMAGLKIYYNSVYMSGNLTYDAATLTTAIYFASTTVTGIDLRNNIFKNDMNNTVNTGAKNYAIYSTAPATSFTEINYNNYYVSGNQGVLGYLGSDKTTLTAWKTATAKDANSLNLNPPFTSATDLHLTPGVTPTLFESSGVVIAGFTDDYDGNVRPGPSGSTNGGATAPDMGADEFDGVPAVAMAYTSSTTTQSTGYIFANGVNQQIIGVKVVINGEANPIGLTDLVFNTTGTDNVANIANAKVYYTGTNSTFATTTQFGSTVTSPNGAFTVTGTQTLTTGTNYFWLTYDIPAVTTSGNLDAQLTSVTVAGSSHTPTITNPAGARTLLSNLAGDYTVGIGGDFSTLKSAFEAANAIGLSADVNFKIISDITETATASLNQWASNFVMNIVPNDATLKTISGTIASGALIKLNGADYVNIDGNFAGNGKYLAFVNLSTTSPVTIQIASLGTATGATYNTIKNCIISTGTMAATSYGIFVGSATIGTAGSDNDYITIQNNTIYKAYYGIYAKSAGTTDGFLDNLVITQNSIGSNTATDYIQYKGIDIQGATAPVVSNNTIFNIKTTGSTNNVGIDIGQYTTNAIISKNKIYGIYSTSSGGWGAYGININSATGIDNTQITNNLIYDIITANYSISSTTYNAFGIRLTGSTSTKIYHNTINLYGSVTNGSSVGMSACLLATVTSVTGLDVRNNIFANSTAFSTSGAKSYTIFVPASFVFGTIDYNDYYSSGTYASFGYFGTETSTFTAWKTLSGQDVNSLNVEPLLNTNSDLRPQLGAPVLAVGTPIATVTTDYANVTRSGTAPSMGAYENGAKASGPSITYTAISNNTNTSFSVLSATITDPIGVNTTSGTNPRLYYKKIANANTYIDNLNTSDGWKYVEANVPSASTFSFVIDYAKISGGVSINDTVQYFVVAQDIFAPINVSVNNAVFTVAPTSVALTAAQFPVTGTINYYRRLGTFSGTINVGTGETYTSLTANDATGLFNKINNSVVNGNIIVNVTSNLTETGAVALNQFSEEGIGNYTLHIQPSAASNDTIRGTYAGGLVRINGADRVTIDGNYSGAGKHLVFMNLSNTANPVINIANASQKLTINNCVVIGGGNLAFAINVSGDNNDTLTLANNIVTNASYGINIIGTTLTKTKKINISNNTIGEVAFPIAKYGIGLSYVNDVSISDNIIQGQVEGNANYNQYGIGISTSSTNININKNKISDFYYTGTAGYGCYGIYSSPSATDTMITISNNIITNIKADGDQSGIDYIIAGIKINNGKKTNVYFNTIKLTGDVLGQGTTYNGFSAGVAVNSSATVLDIRNNIIVNSMGSYPGSTMTNKTYGIYSLAPASQFTYLDYNNVFVNGIDPFHGYIGSADRVDLAAWKTATGISANCMNLNPLFTSATDLSLQATSQLAGSAAVIPAVTTDYTGALRGLYMPTIGAYELAEPAFRTLNLKLYLQGLCRTLDGSSFAGIMTPAQGLDIDGNQIDQFGADVADEVIVDLYDNTLTSISSMNAQLNINGTISISDFYSKELNGSYYIVITNRNHIRTWSALPISFSSKTITYDFTTAANKAAGNNLANVNGFYANYLGDPNQDGFVDITDLSDMDNDLTLGTSGYNAFDLNGDVYVDITDLSDIDNNLTSGIYEITP